MRSPPTIRRQLMAWVLGALSVGALLLMLSAYWLTLREIDAILDDSLRQTALLLADRDLRGPIARGDPALALPYADTESRLVAIARRPDGAMLFTSAPELALRFDATPGMSAQRAGDMSWRVYTVSQSDRIVQVAQPVDARREVAAQTATQLLVPLLLLILLIGVLLVIALRRGLRPLAAANAALALRNAESLDPLDLDALPAEMRPVLRTLNDLLRRLAGAFETQRHFVANAAHELRTPITALQLQVQVLERSRDPAERDRATADLTAGIARARHLIEQLLDLSRATADGDPGRSLGAEPVALAALARDAVVRWEREAERRGIDLGAEIDAPVAARGNPAQLDILLNNLVENALRYTPAGGVVDVVAGEIDGVPTLRVVDTGPGISPTDRARVFERFYRSAAALAGLEPGSGLGLAIVKSIADRHGASVTLHEGRDGRGLEVRVAFPPGPA